MRTQAAVLWSLDAPWKVETVDLAEPGPAEVLVRIGAAGICHSDEHSVTGDNPSPIPVIGGHEGAGVVEQVGPGVTSVAVGDHVALSFLPSCGRCPSCVDGYQYLCDLGAAEALSRRRTPAGRARHHPIPPLEDINTAFDDLREGRNIRGGLVMDGILPR